MNLNSGSSEVCRTVSANTQKTIKRFLEIITAVCLCKLWVLEAMVIAWCSPSPRKNVPKTKEEEDEEDENVQQLEQCARAYKCLEDCLVKTDRNWRACQAEVRALKECHDAKVNKLSPSSPSPSAGAQLQKSERARKSKDCFCMKLCMYEVKLGLEEDYEWAVIREE